MSVKKIEKGKLHGKKEESRIAGAITTRSSSNGWVFGEGSNGEEDQVVYELFTPQGASLLIKHYGNDSDESSLRTRAGNNRICHLGGDSCSHCDNSDYCLQAQIRRIVECDNDGNQQLVKDENGQSTVEFAIVFGLMMCIIAGLGALMSALSDGVLVQHAVTSASHNVEVLVSGAVDALIF